MSAWTFPVLRHPTDGRILGHRIERDGALAGLIVFRPSGEVVFIVASGPGEVEGRTVSSVDAEIRTAFAAQAELLP